MDWGKLVYLYFMNNDFQQGVFPNQSEDEFNNFLIDLWVAHKEYEEKKHEWYKTIAADPSKTVTITISKEDHCW